MNFLIWRNCRAKRNTERNEEDKAKANEGMKRGRTKGEGEEYLFSGNSGTKETVTITRLFSPRNYLSSWPSFKIGISLEKAPMMVSLTQIQMST